VRESGGGCGTLILSGSQRMRLQTCFAYSSSIQGSSSPHQIVDRVRDEVEGGGVTADVADDV
jgi:hypothetical protein